MTAHELRLDLPAAHTDVRVARNVVRHFARLLGVADREVDQLVLVVSELLANAIDHGGGNAAMDEQQMARDVRMKLFLVVNAEEWEVHVTDQGGGDPDEVRKLIEPDGLPDLEDDRGRGLFLLAQMVDRFTVEVSTDGQGLTFSAHRRHGG